MNSLRIKFQPRTPGRYDEVFAAREVGLSFRVTASASLPICHIESQPTAYLETERPSQQPTPLVFANLLSSNARNIKVVQISATGLGQQASQTLLVVNTINSNYEIQMTRLQESSGKIQSNFMNYTIIPGERLQIKFSYVPDRDSFKRGPEEAFYILRIPAYDVQIPILVVGISSEPQVSISTTKVNFGALHCNQSR